VRLDIRRIGAIKDRDEVVGNATRVKVVKNKVAPPFNSQIALEIEDKIRAAHGLDFDYERGPSGDGDDDLVEM